MLTIVGRSRPMTERAFPDPDTDPIYLIRTAGRLAQMLLEIRDEYINDPRPDTLDQFERRLGELTELRDQLRALRAGELVSDRDGPA
jgi:hypothetical protein